MPSTSTRPSRRKRRTPSVRSTSSGAGAVFIWRYGSHKWSVVISAPLRRDARHGTSCTSSAASAWAAAAASVYWPRVIRHAKMKKINCFKAYDVRGRVPSELDEDIAYRVGRAYADFVRPRTVAVGRDIRASSPALAAAVMRGLTDS